MITGRRRGGCQWNQGSDSLSKRGSTVSERRVTGEKLMMWTQDDDESERSSSGNRRHGRRKRDGEQKRRDSDTVVAGSEIFLNVRLRLQKREHVLSVLVSSCEQGFGCSCLSLRV